jgi:hypothetical protein
LGFFFLLSFASGLSQTALPSNLKRRNCVASKLLFLGVLAVKSSQIAEV